MSRGAIYNLVTRDDRFDAYFTASDYLRKRLDIIRAKRKAGKKDNIQPSFLDIENSHILYIRATYRPHAMIASEYVQQKPTGDGASFLMESSSRVVKFDLPIFGHFTNDIILRIKFKEIGPHVISGQRVLFKYCAFPGLRLLKNVTLKSDEVLIDEYTSDDAVNYAKLFVRADQKIGWMRCHGQQEEKLAQYMANNFMGTLTYCDGPQTPKEIQPSLEMFIPLQFWFCKDVSQAILNDLIANTQRAVTCELSSLEKIIIALIPDVNNPGAMISTPLPFSKMPIEIELYSNNLFVNPEVYDVFASRIGFNLIRVHKRHTCHIQHVKDLYHMSQLKYPAEYLIVGVRDKNNLLDPDRWWLMGTPSPRTNEYKLLVPAVIWNPLQIAQLVVREAREISTLESFVKTLEIKEHTIRVIPPLGETFYNAYSPIRYIDNNMLVSPSDSSVLLINFCLYPGKFNPSGSFNLSAGRELYINLEVKDFAQPLLSGRAEMLVFMSALNFLIRRGDKLHLRYSL